MLRIVKKNDIEQVENAFSHKFAKPAEAPKTPVTLQQAKQLVQDADKR
jgi:uncharacterized protein YcgL (UPF0745 family)